MKYNVGEYKRVIQGEAVRMECLVAGLEVMEVVGTQKLISSFFSGVSAIFLLNT